MTKQDLTKINLAELSEIANKHETCREMLVRGLMQLKELENRGLNVVATNNVSKPDPKTIHTYNPRDAYGPTKLEKTYSGKPNSHGVV